MKSGGRRSQTRASYLACTRDDAQLRRVQSRSRRDDCSWWIQRECISGIHCNGRPEYFWTWAARKDSEIRARVRSRRWIARSRAIYHVRPDGDVRLCVCVCSCISSLRFNNAPRAKCNAARHDSSILSATFCSAGLDQVEESFNHRPWIHYGRGAENGY